MEMDIERRRNKKLNFLTKTISEDNKSFRSKTKIYNFDYLGNSIPLFSQPNVKILKRKSEEKIKTKYHDNFIKNEIVSSHSYKNFIQKLNRKKIIFEAISTIEKNSNKIMAFSKQNTLYNSMTGSLIEGEKYEKVNTYNSSNKQRRLKRFFTFSEEKPQQNNEKGYNIIKYVFEKLKLNNELSKIDCTIDVNKFLKYEDSDLKLLNLNSVARKILQNFNIEFNSYLIKNKITKINQKTVNHFFEIRKIYKKRHAPCLTPASSQYESEVFVPSKQIKVNRQINTNRTFTSNQPNKFRTYINNKMKIKSEKLYSRFKLINTEVNLFLEKKSAKQTKRLSQKNTAYSTNINSPIHDYLHKKNK